MTVKKISVVLGDNVSGQNIRKILEAGYTIREESLQATTNYRLRRDFRGDFILAFYNKKGYLKKSQFTVDDLICSGKRFFITRSPLEFELDENNKKFNLKNKKNE